MKSAKNNKAAKYFITFVSPVLAVLFTVYFIVLQFMSPSNFWGTIFSFSMVWLLMGILFAALFIFRKKDYFSGIPAILKKIFAAGSILLRFALNRGVESSCNRFVKKNTFSKHRVLFLAALRRGC